MGYTKYVPEGDIIYMRLNSGKVAKTLCRQPDIHVDLDAEGNVLAVEVVGAHSTPFDAVNRVFEEFFLGVVPHPPVAPNAPDPMREPVG